jgi:hypothetical protein
MTRMTHPKGYIMRLSGFPSSPGGTLSYLASTRLDAANGRKNVLLLARTAIADPNVPIVEIRRRDR